VSRARGLLHRIEYLGARLLRACLAPFPPDARIRFAGAVGRLVLPRLPATRRRLERNLALGLPAADAAERRRIAREMSGHFGRVAGEYECLDRIAGDPARVRLDGPGLAVLLAARAGGRGAVIVSAHFGNWEAIRFGLGQRGIPCAMIYRAFNNPWFDRAVRARMRAAGEPVLAKGREGMRAFLMHVAKGGVALVLVDQKQTGAPLLPFLDRPAETALAAAELATRLRVPLIPAFAARRADGTGFDADFETPVAEGSGAARMTEVNARIAGRIRACPGQWFWLHNRWR
jgi:KDO2-lipid IV(A) lauroyltransferase